IGLWPAAPIHASVTFRIGRTETSLVLSVESSPRASAWPAAKAFANDFSSCRLRLRALVSSLPIVHDARAVPSEHFVAERFTSLTVVPPDDSTPRAAKMPLEVAVTSCPSLVSAGVAPPHASVPRRTKNRHVRDVCLCMAHSVNVGCYPPSE